MSTGRGQEEDPVVILLWAPTAAFSAAIVAVLATITGTGSTSTTIEQTTALRTTCVRNISDTVDAVEAPATESR
jgi:hypothetical protein